MATENGKASSKAKKERWFHHSESCSQSGMGQQRYGKENGLAVATFRYWKRQWTKRRHATKPIFYPLTLQPPPATLPVGKDAGLSLYLGNDNYRLALSEKAKSTASLKTPRSCRLLICRSQIPMVRTKRRSR